MWVCGCMGEYIRPRRPIIIGIYTLIKSQLFLQLCILGGEVHHRMSGLENNDNRPRFVQMYILDQEQQLQLRLERHPTARQQLLKILQETLHQVISS